MKVPPPCRLCSGDRWENVASFLKPPLGENSFGVQDYCRELWRCNICGLFYNSHKYDLSSIYIGDYRRTAYEHGHLSRFKAIMDLPQSKSDNKHRIKRIVKYLDERLACSLKRMCDVGSGLGVFPAGMLKEGWNVTAIDPDESNLRHLRAFDSNIRCVSGYFPNVEIDTQFDLLTFNKVLEHIEPVVETLAAAGQYLSSEGLVYIELPDGESAADLNYSRPEFFLEHYYAFSMDSVALLARRSGMRVDHACRIREPSGKLTLYAFLRRI